MSSLNGLFDEIETKLKYKGILPNKWEYLENPNAIYTFNSYNDDPTKFSLNNSTNSLNKNAFQQFKDEINSQFSEFQKEIKDNLNSMNEQIEYIKKNNYEINELKKKNL